MDLRFLAGGGRGDYAQGEVLEHRGIEGGDRGPFACCIACGDLKRDRLAQRGKGVHNPPAKKGDGKFAQGSGGVFEPQKRFAREFSQDGGVDLEVRPRGDPFGEPLHLDARERDACKRVEEAVEQGLECALKTEGERAAERRRGEKSPDGLVKLSARKKGFRVKPVPEHQRLIQRGVCRQGRVRRAGNAGLQGRICFWKGSGASQGALLDRREQEVDLLRLLCQHALETRLPGEGPGEKQRQSGHRAGGGEPEGKLRPFESPI